MQDVSLSLVEAKPIPPPKVFISYSWSSPGHQEQVRQWAERLLSDGVEVVIDIFDLKEGHDKYSFMERMVVDQAITHVLVVCDKTYAEKSDAKKAGVGTESQIISREVYDKVEQTKFIPLVCEFSESREPCLPVFMKSRIWINFSSPEETNQNWEKLVRSLHGKPVHQKPRLGKPPSYITASPSVPASAAIGKLISFRIALLSNAKGLNLYREDFLCVCIQEADAVRFRRHSDSLSSGQKVLDDCGRLKDIRNYIVDWVLLESAASEDNQFCESLLKLLEDLRGLKSRPADLSNWNESWPESHSVFVYDTFLYVIAALLKTRSYGILREVFTSHYLRPKSERYGEKRLDDFGCFCGYSESLQSVLSPERHRLYSPAAELIKRQADRTDIAFPAVIEAELLVLLSAFITSDVRWDPQTFLYNSDGDFPFFVRAIQHKHFQNLALVTGIADAEALRAAVKAGQLRLGLNRSSGYAMASHSFWDCMNMDHLDSRK